MPECDHPPGYPALTAGMTVHRRARAEDRRTHERARSEERLDGAGHLAVTAEERRHAVPEGQGPTDPDTIKAEIDATREQLGRTVDELSRRLDVPARAKEGVYRARDTAVETYRESPPIVLGVVLALVATAVGLVVWRRKRSSRRRNK
jgi:cobalamin biosynthesis Mg chelatase CobN